MGVYREDTVRVAGGIISVAKKYDAIIAQNTSNGMIRKSLRALVC